MTISVSWLHEGVSNGVTGKGGNQNCAWGGGKLVPEKLKDGGGVKGTGAVLAVSSLKPW